MHRPSLELPLIHTPVCIQGLVRNTWGRVALLSPFLRRRPRSRPHSHPREHLICKGWERTGRMHCTLPESPMRHPPVCHKSQARLEMGRSALLSAISAPLPRRPRPRSDRCITFDLTRMEGNRPNASTLACIALASSNRKPPRPGKQHMGQGGIAIAFATTPSPVPPPQPLAPEHI